MLLRCVIVAAALTVSRCLPRLSVAARLQAELHEGDVVLNKKELADHQWLRVDELPSVLSPELFRAVRPGLPPIIQVPDRPLEELTKQRPIPPLPDER